MKVGDIIRRKASDGKPIGPHMQICVIKGDRVYADVLGTDEPNILILKKNVHVCKHKSLCVSEKCLQRLKSGEQIAVDHPVCKQWLTVLSDPPEVITFRTAFVVYKATFVVESVKENIYGRQRDVRVIISYKIKLL